MSSEKLSPHHTHPANENHTDQNEYQPLTLKELEARKGEIPVRRLENELAIARQAYRQLPPENINADIYAQRKALMEKIVYLMGALIVRNEQWSRGE